MNYQTSRPVEALHMNISSRSWGELVHWVQEGDATYDLPYQRGDAWSYEQRIMLIFSILSGTPIPALIVNQRPASMWFDEHGNRLPIYTVIDGKQRLTTVRAFMESELWVPATWFPAEQVESSVDTGDGPYLTCARLTVVGRRFFERNPAPLAEASLKSVKAEAQVYLRVNGAGTPQTDEDMARAAQVAEETQ